MSYNAAISRDNPGAFLFLLDHSASMDMALGGQPGMYKHRQAADALNRTVSEIILRSSNGLEIRDYFDVGIITYRTNGIGVPVVTTPFQGVPAEDPFWPVSQIEQVAVFHDRPVKESDGNGGIIEVMQNIPQWLEPEASGGTPMCQALSAATQALKSWVSEHPRSFPPICIQITDGISTDGDPLPIAWDIMDIATNDGTALFFNIHLSDVDAAPIMFPGDEESLPRDNGFAHQLFRMSSSLPESSRAQAQRLGIPVCERSRGYVFNSDLTALVQFLDIGTRPALGPGLH